MQARTWFCCEAIRKEKPNKVKCDADEIEIYSQQDEPLFVPPTSLLVAVASMTKQDGIFQSRASTCRTLLLMDLQDGKWIREDEEAPVNRGTSKPGTWCFVFSKLNDFYLLSLCLHLILLSFEDRLLCFQDTINIGRAVLSCSGVAWSGSVALLLCRMRFSKPI